MRFVQDMKKPVSLAGLFLLFIVNTPLYSSHGKPESIQTRDITVGTGVGVERFSKVLVLVDSWLPDGKRLITSDEANPTQFVIGSGEMIPGIDMGVQGMRVGGYREIIVPPGLGFGSQGASMGIPKQASLRTEIKLLDVKPPPFRSIGNDELRSKINDGIKVIDIRRQEEWYSTGVVDGSIRITAFDKNGRFLPSFMDNLKTELESDSEFVLICRTGNRTAILSNWLATEGGYPGVLNVKNGIVSWIENGNPVSKL